ncbi:MAG: hypothetical protein ACRD0D_05795, partial [Acidimicrobiales bacterium]
MRVARLSRSTTTALAAGLLLTAAIPPFGAWVAAIAGLALLRATLRALPWHRRLLAGAAAGLGLFAPSLWWMTEFHAVGWVAVVVVESAFFALAAAAVPPGPAGTLA